MLATSGKHTILYLLVDPTDFRQRDTGPAGIEDPDRSNPLHTLTQPLGTSYHISGPSRRRRCKIGGTQQSRRFLRAAPELDEYGHFVAAVIGSDPKHLEFDPENRFDQIRITFQFQAFAIHPLPSVYARKKRGQITVFTIEVLDDP